MRKVLSALASTLLSTPLALVSVLWNLLMVSMTLGLVAGGVTLVFDLAAAFEHDASAGNVATSVIGLAILSFLAPAFSLVTWASLDTTRETVREALDDVRHVADTARALSDERSEHADAVAAHGGRLSESAPSSAGELSETHGDEGDVTLAIENEEDDEDEATHEREHTS